MCRRWLNLMATLAEWTTCCKFTHITYIRKRHYFTRNKMLIRILRLHHHFLKFIPYKVHADNLKCTENRWHCVRVRVCVWSPLVRKNIRIKFQQVLNNRICDGIRGFHQNFREFPFYAICHGVAEVFLFVEFSHTSSAKHRFQRLQSLSQTVWLGLFRKFLSDA